MTKKGSYMGSEYTKGFVGISLASRARSAEILRVAKQMAEKQHAENMKKLTESKMSASAKKKVIASLQSRSR